MSPHMIITLPCCGCGRDFEDHAIDNAARYHADHGHYCTTCREENTRDCD